MRRHDLPSFQQAVLARSLSTRQRDASVRIWEICLALEISPPPDLRKLDHAFKRVLEKHPEMRSIFTVSPNDVRVEWLDVNEFQLDVINVENAPRDEVLRLADERAAIGWGSLIEPLVRLSAFVGKSSVVLLLEMHHLNVDGWSVELIFRDFLSSYFDVGAVDKAKATFADFIDWESEFVETQAGHKQLEYWKHKLSNIGPALALPFDRPESPGLIIASKEHRFEFKPEETDAIKALSTALGVTLFAPLLSGWVAAISQLSGALDVLVHVPVARRPSPHFRETVGKFSQGIGLRIALDPNEHSSDLIRRVAQEITVSLDNQDYPQCLVTQQLGSLNEAMRDRAQSRYRAPVFSILAAHRNDPFGLGALLQDASERWINIGGFQVRPVDVGYAVGIGGDRDLWPQLTIGPDRIRGWLRYNGNIFDPGTAGRIASAFTGITVRMVQELGTPIGKLL